MEYTLENGSEGMTNVGCETEEEEIEKMVKEAEANKEAGLDGNKQVAEKNMTVTTAMKKGGEKTVKKAALALEAWKKAAQERVAAKELARKIIEEEAKANSGRIKSKM
mgnify:CR=1 FL=1